MFISKKMLALLGLASCITLASPGTIQANTSQYPQKPISLVIAFPAGTTSDSIGRIFASELGNALGQTVVLENKPGGNATGILAGATFAKRAGIDMLHVPYKGSPNALTDLMGGRVDVMFNDLASSLPYIQSGKRKTLQPMWLLSLRPKDIHNALLPGMH